MSKTTAFIFFGIILVGLAISLFTLKGRGWKTGADEEPVVPAPLVSAVPEKADPELPVEPAVPEKKVEAPKEPTPAPAPVAEPTPVQKGPGRFQSPEAAMSALTEKIGNRDYPGFVAVTGEDAIPEPIREDVKALIGGADVKLDPAKPQVEISKSVGAFRWALNFVPAVGEGAARQLYVDFTEVGDERYGVAKVALPIPSASDRGVDGSDALTVAHAFAKAVIKRDFNTARALADTGTVTDERVAALMIAVEEGEFHLKDDRPLVVTLSRDDLTWVLARVVSDAMSSEFAIELGKVGQAWKVNGLTFSKVLSALSDAAGGGDVAYSPIVEDPSGGDSLVLYFEFDQDGLTPRTRRQLKIVADILAQGADRVIHINGHADALGSDAYNVGLSNRRAEAIRQALVGFGVKPEQVVTEAFGAAKPRKPNFNPDGTDNPSGRSQNRRAEVLLDF
ncbi:MAG TPA: OmpA family protein [Bacteroidia bacterium]|nr:OmpA family protein [Bacteroidia bacterium]